MIGQFLERGNSQCKTNIRVIIQALFVFLIVTFVTLIKILWREQFVELSSERGIEELTIFEWNVL